MIGRKIPSPGDVYWINPNPTSGNEIRDRHQFVVITPTEINKLGLVTCLPITSGGNHARQNGLTVVIAGHDTTGVAVCNQMRTFDLSARAGEVKYIETLDQQTTREIINRVTSIIDPG
ncbi:growth inhibitor PemK [Acidithiobacillus thiooxidans]|uniref:Growth inhibitor PemK n=1 Tax=Acidithiobacillus thiooxidans TaxID=930 RepID=A0A1C2I534_ACITH|nr:type II toxin-antitoxin system PemK/MazF family toxin [Acidithiobacillus thiooxidans]OCX67930.1 growth inhibitor PemK [Acidithiobacillus thiooxidans]OCX71089.1 growth inhibitor PemK [Acidithiobacillus thiooxidans]OCX71545.1 growth inhibitor PemK [Acidithiobacillus thiooxidans]OCX78701.1 growth inhibitor PemK [Acidithiobacillus thiooxidans]OCX80430.1 growth inhibitor PemK [Acidithiobacillus thiooxidans]